MDTKNPERPVSDTTEKITGAAAQAWETTRDTASEAYQHGERYVRDNPATSALTLFGLGCLLGLLIGWSLGREEKLDYSASARKLAKGWSKKLNFD